MAKLSKTADKIEKLFKEATIEHEKLVQELPGIPASGDAREAWLAKAQSEEVGMGPAMVCPVESAEYARERLAKIDAALAPKSAEVGK